MLEHQAVTRAVHGLQTVLRIITVEQEHIILVVGSMAADLPQFQVEHVGRDDLRVATHVVLLSDKLDQFIVDVGSVREEEARARAQLVEEEEILLLTQHTVVVLLRLLHLLLPLLQLLGVREGNSVHTLEGVVFSVTQPVTGAILHHGETLDERGVGKMRTHAKINQGTTAVHAGHGIISHLAGDNLELEGVVLEELESLGLGDLTALEDLLALHQLVGMLVDVLAISLRDTPRNDIDTMDVY